jgi:hypothetical protein
MAMRTATDPSSSTSGRWGLPENTRMYLQPSAFATVVRVERGTVIVSQKGDLEDRVLTQDEQIIVPAGSQAVAWAFTEAVISVNESTE